MITRKQIAQNKAMAEMLKVSVLYRKGGCWPWHRYKDESGYGYIAFDGFKFAVHRLAFLHFKGVIPPKFEVMHTCDNPFCFNPEHLFLGTHKENMEDMVRKGRSPKPKQSPPKRPVLSESDREWEATCQPIKEMVGNLADLKTMPEIPDKRELIRRRNVQMAALQQWIARRDSGKSTSATSSTANSPDRKKESA